MSVMRALEEAEGPLSAKELWSRLSETGVGLATVYRALKRGIEEGQLDSVEMTNGGVRYEPRGRDHHHHFLCSVCDRAFDLEGCVKDLSALLPQGFRMTGHEVVLFGTCDVCEGTA